jgi:hypothetical protein
MTALAIIIFGILFWVAANIIKNSLTNSQAKDRRIYKRRSHPKNIEKSIQDLLELELQEFLLEEEVKEKARNREQHPTAYLRKIGGTLDRETQEILAKIANDRQGPRRRARGHQFWWGE